MKKLILLTIMTSTLMTNMASAEGCREAYLKAKAKIFQAVAEGRDTEVSIVAGGVLGLIGSAAVTFGPGKWLALNPASADTLGTVGGVATGAAVTVAPTTIPITARYYDWKINEMDDVVAMIEESRVGMGYRLTKTANIFNVSASDVATIVSELDFNQVLCSATDLTTAKGLVSLINQNLQFKMLNSGVLR